MSRVASVASVASSRRRVNLRENWARGVCLTTLRKEFIAAEKERGGGAGGGGEDE